MSSERWVEIEGIPGLEHRDGILWSHAKAHRHWQRHSAQTRGFIDGVYVERCSCGAFGPAPWTMSLGSRRIHGLL